jgi:hypothetical protein
MQSSFRAATIGVAALVLAVAITQALYTALSMAGADVPRRLMWGGEALLFALLAAYAGAALAQARALHLGFAAILSAAILNVVQVGVGLTLFAPFGEAARAVPELAPAAAGIVAYSFMVYNAAKVLLALALIVFARARLQAGGKALGGLGLIVGALAFVANTLSMALGRDFTDLPVAGGSGVVATILLAALLFTLPRED